VTLERALFVSIAVVTLLMTAVTFVVAGPSAASSVVIGGGLALLNLWALRGIISVLAAVVTSQGARPSSAYGFFIVPKVIALLGVTWLLLARHVVTAGPLAIGYMALPIGVAIGALVCKKGAES
jgi:hypothetical protein